jgi:hypothetical protein
LSNIVLRGVLHASECGVCFFQVGWKHKEAVAYLEEKRKEKSNKFYQVKKKLVLLRKQAVAKA